MSLLAQTCSSCVAPLAVVLVALAQTVLACKVLHRLCVAGDGIERVRRWQPAC